LARVCTAPMPATPWASSTPGAATTTASWASSWSPWMWRVRPNGS